MIGELDIRRRSRAVTGAISVDGTTALDVLVIALVVTISALPYFGHLGFYSDDWSFLRALAGAHDKSFPTLFAAVLPQVGMRPVQAAYLAGLYELVGTDATRFQIVAAILLVGCGVFAYLALRGFGLSRMAAMIAAVVYTTLPNYSSDRLWLAAAQALVSALCFFLSSYALARAGTGEDRTWRYWAALSAGALLVSALAYEVFLPLFVLAAMLMPLALRVPKPRRLALCVVNPILVAVVSVFKVAVSTRLGGGDLHGRLSWLLHLAKGALVINFGDYGIGLPLVAIKMFVARPAWPAALAASAAAVLVYLWIQSARTESFGGYRRPLVVGLLCFIGGYAIFVTNDNALLTPTGSGNRVNIAAALGAALLLTAGAGWLASRLRDGRIQARTLGVVAAVIVGAGVLTNATLAGYWEEAATTQSTVLQALKQDEPTLPAHSTVLLDGFCPYSGPGVVFETTWDVTGALRVLYGSSTLEGDVVTTRMSVTPDGVQSYAYQTLTIHPYGDQLLVYDYRSHSLAQLGSQAAAVAYFASRPMLGCAAGSPGYGAKVI